MGSDKFISTRFRYIIQRCKKTGNLIMFRWYFSKYEICSKSFTKVLYGNMFLVSENIFKLVCHCASWKWSQICCPHVRDIAEKSLNKLLLLFILKSSNRRWSVKRGVLKYFANFTGNHLCWSLFIIKLQVLQRSLKETPTQVFSGKIYEIFVNFCFCIFIGSFIYNAWKRCS